MGNCCCPAKDDEVQALNTTTANHSRNSNTFQGQGHRLGTANENATRQNVNNQNNNDIGSSNKHHDIIPPPIIDENLTDADREKIRADRAAAAEARLKKQGIKPLPKKVPIDPNAPLRGPNSKPTMTWNLG